MKVLVTGMAGFVGSHLGRRLVNDGHEVIALLRSQTQTDRIQDYLPAVQVIEADLRDAASYLATLKSVRPEVCFHLAWYAEPGRFWTSTENFNSVAASLELAKVLVASECEHLIGVGTCAEYAWHHGHLIEEETPLEAAQLYGTTKNATRAMLEAYLESSAMGFSWARLFFPFGPGEPDVRLIPSVARALLRGDRARCSHGHQLRDFIYVEDCVDALLAIATSRATGALNLGTGIPTSIRHIVETLVRVTGQTPNSVEFGAVATDPSEPGMVVADPSKLFSATAWRPKWDLEAALQETVEWWRIQA